MTAKRVLYVHQYFAVPQGGGAVRSYHVANKLAARGYRVTVLTSDAMLDSNFRHADLDFRLIVLSASYSARMSYFRRVIAFFWFVARASLWILRDAFANRYDVVYASSTPLTVVLPSRLAAAIHRCPMILEVRDLWPEMPIAVGALRHPWAICAAQTLEKLAYRWSAHIVALSPPMAESISIAAPGRTVSVIPNFPSVEPMSTTRAWPSPPGEIRIAYCGSLNRLNDVPFLIDLIHELRMRGVDARLRVRGRGPILKTLEQQLVAKGLSPADVDIQGALIDKRRVAEVLTWCDLAACVFVDIPAMEKNSANKFFDAIGVGRPVLINYGGWQEELLRESGAGLRVDRNPALAADQLLDWWRDHRHTAGASARRLADERFSRSRACDRIERAIWGVCR